MTTNHFGRGIVDQIGKLIYPRLQPFQRRREMKTLVAALSVGLLMAALLTIMMFAKNGFGR